MEKILLTVLAKPTKRYLACIIDGLLIGVLVLPMFIYRQVNDLSGSKLVYFTIAFLLYKTLVYLLVDCLIPLATNGKTIGRYFLNLRLVKRDGNYATISNYFLRALIFIIIAVIADVFALSFVAYIIWTLIFIISIYLIYNDDYRMTFHDKIARTMILQDVDIKCKE